METMAEAPATQPGELRPQRAKFTGSGGEYFRIWIVNLLLSVVTLGLYSPWAKVRREQYFHRNTRLADASFGYHAKPIAILRGRAIAVAALVGLQLSQLVSPYLNAALLVALVVGTPWLILQALRFRLHNTSWRAIRFRFHGSLGEAARVFLALGLLVPVSLGLAMPFVLHRQTQFRVGSSALGGSRFAFSAPVGGFYVVFALTSLLFLGAFTAGAVPVGMSAWAAGWAPQPGSQLPPRLVFGLVGVYLLALALTAPFAQVRLQNLVWNNVALGPHRFASDQRFLPFISLHAVNLLAMLATLGLFRPFAVVRVARYRAEHLALIPGGSLSAFVADAEAGATATGEEFADFLDLDIGF
jgi:uncharacterized membrane protein YjgN (DUF898 family)